MAQMGEVSEPKVFERKTGLHAVFVVDACIKVIKAREHGSLLW